MNTPCTKTPPENLAVTPDFLCIGAIKAGTTWLHACIAEHPEIFAPPTKEIEFFNNRYEQGEQWYQRFFQDANGMTCGESTPGYLHHPDSAMRIHKLNKDMKLIICLRNPVERALSHFLMDGRKSTTMLNAQIQEFSKLAKENTGHFNKYINYGLYAEQIDNYLKFFPISQMHFVVFDDIADRPEELLKATYQFLNVDDSYLPSVMRKKINPASDYKSLYIFILMQKAVRFSEASFLKGLILKLKTNGVRDRILNLLRKPQEKPSAPPETRRILTDLYKQPNQRLEQLTNLNLSHWNSN